MGVPAGIGRVLDNDGSDLARMTAMQKNTLSKIISALIDEFGYSEVRKSLDDYSAYETKVDKSKESPPVNCKKPNVRRDAITIVEAMKIDDDRKKEILLLLAKEFEKKVFMPNVNSVRAFIAQQGKDMSSIKSRQQAASSVFKFLADWETDNLCELHARGSYGGPKSLSAIAKSIEKMGA